MFGKTTLRPIRHPSIQTEGSNDLLPNPFCCPAFVAAGYYGGVGLSFSASSRRRHSGFGASATGTSVVNAYHYYRNRYYVPGIPTSAGPQAAATSAMTLSRGFGKNSTEISSAPPLAAEISRSLSQGPRN